MSLANKRCLPCEGGVPALTDDQARRLHAEVPAWALVDQRLRRRFVFADFSTAMGFVVRMALLAESEGHHPDFTVHYRQVDVELWTHAVGGLSENDFILAAKIDQLEA